MPGRVPIPAASIGLAKAFERVCETCIPDWRQLVEQVGACSVELEARYAALGVRKHRQNPSKIKGASNLGRDQLFSAVSEDGALDVLETATDADFSSEQLEHIKVAAEYQALTLRLSWRRAEADRILREALASGALIPFTRGPLDSENRAVEDNDRWLVNLEYEPGFRTNFVEGWRADQAMPEQPGPTIYSVGDTPLPVFFDHSAFDAWIKGTKSTQSFTILPEDQLTTTKQRNIRLALKQEFPSVDDKVPYGKIPEIINRIKDDYQKRMATDRAPDIGGPSEATVRRVLGLEKLPGR